MRTFSSEVIYSIGSVSTSFDWFNVIALVSNHIDGNTFEVYEIEDTVVMLSLS